MMFNNTHVWVRKAFEHGILVEEVADVVVGVAGGLLLHVSVVGRLGPGLHLGAGDSSGHVWKVSMITLWEHCHNNIIPYLIIK